MLLLCTGYLQECTSVNVSTLAATIVCMTILTMSRKISIDFLHELEKSFLLVHLKIISILAASNILMLNIFEQKGIDYFGTKNPKKNYS